MELVNYLVIVITLVIILYVIFYFLLAPLEGSLRAQNRPFVALALAVAVASIVGLSLAPVVDYNWCRNADPGILEGAVSFNILSCQEAQSTVMWTLSVAAVLIISILVISILYSLL